MAILNWRKYPDEKPKDDQPVVFSVGGKVYAGYYVGQGGYFLEEQEKNCYMYHATADKWIPLEN